MQVTSLIPQPVFELEGVSRTYAQGGSQIRAVDSLDLRIERGEFVAVVGPSGSGKTTLLQLLGALDRPTSGHIRFEGRDLADLKDGDLTRLRLHTIGFVFQQFNLIPTLTARQYVVVALAPAGLRRAEREPIATRLLETVGLGQRGGHLPSQLSGGEQQRVAIARALANEPDVLLADEPTGNLDSATGEEIIGLLRSLSDERGQTVVLITHDPTVATRAPRVLRMQDGRLVDPEPAVAAGGGS
jgi:putative ABC transport system ATP-binding protein